MRALLVFGVSGGHVYSTGGGDHLSDVLAAVGVENVLAGAPVTARIPLERVLALAPELILHTAPSERFPDDDAARRFWSALPSVPAVAHGHVTVWPDGTLAQNGPNLAAALVRLEALVERVAAAPTTGR